MDSKTITAIIIAIIVSSAVTVGVLSLTGPGSEANRSIEPPLASTPKQVPSPASFQGTNEAIQIQSSEHLAAILAESSAFSNNLFDVDLRTQSFREPSSGGGGGGGDPSGIFQSIVPLVAKGGPAYSTTNNQVQNVDEPDYLKNDAKYVYIVAGNTLSIIDAYPAKDARLVLKVALDIESQYLHNIFLNGDRLVIFYDAQKVEDFIPLFDYAPRPSYGQATHVLIVDVSDKENPEILKDYSVDGYFGTARMIGSHVYLVTNNHADYQYPKLPVIYDGPTPILTSEAFYFDNFERLSSFNTIVAINLLDETINSETYLMGDTGTFYVSDDNFYLTYRQNTRHMSDGAQDRFFDVIVPLLPRPVQDQIKSIQNDASSMQKWLKISQLLQDSYNQMPSIQRDDLLSEIKAALDSYDARIRQQLDNTFIHKVSLDGDKIQYAAKGSVPGILLNQFSMDQKGDRFRVATTVDSYSGSGGVSRASAVFILDEQLDEVGSISGIAPDESIFSARFIGDRLYLVTFERIDPFFVIDLSDDPQILGELKIPGFSTYLHPFGDDHIIGIGKETALDRRNIVYEVGIKLALFDVRDVGNPLVADDVIIGDQTTSSASLYDHKAFFFDPNSGLLSIPVKGIINRLPEIYDLPYGTPKNNYWGGFYVFDLSQDGFEVRGTISHTDFGSPRLEFDNGRTFYIGDTLYTASEKRLKMNSIDDLKHINSVSLERSAEFIPSLSR